MIFHYEATQETHTSGTVEIEDIYDEDGELCLDQMREQAEEEAYDAAEYQIRRYQGDLFVYVKE